MKKISAYLLFSVFSMLTVVVGAQCGEKADAGTQGGGKSVVVYYSLTGNTATAAQAMAQSLGADIVKIEDAEALDAKTVTDNYQKLKGTEWAIKPVSIDFSKYSKVFIGAPVWYGSPAPEIYTFINRTNFSGKPVVVFVTMGGSLADSALKEFATKVGGKSGKVIASYAISASQGLTTVTAKAKEIASKHAK